MDARLLACASLVTGEYAADVCTDHAYLPVYLVGQGICRRAAACDINEKPLASARANILNAGLSDRISCFLSDGLDSVPDEGITDVVIAGVGGELIVKILERAEWIRERRVNLVLQPMTKWDHLRKYLFDNRFDVTREVPCRDGKFVYSVIQAVYSGVTPDFPCSMRYLFCGKVTPDSDEGRGYLKRQAWRLEMFGKGLMYSPEKKALGEECIKTAEQILADCE